MGRQYYVSLYYGNRGTGKLWLVSARAGSLTMGSPELVLLTCATLSVCLLSPLALQAPEDYVSDLHLVQSSLASTVVSCLIASAVCQLNCQSLVRLSANSHPLQNSSPGIQRSTLVSGHPPKTPLSYCFSITQGPYKKHGLNLNSATY